MSLDCSVFLFIFLEGFVSFKVVLFINIFKNVSILSFSINVAHITKCTIGDVDSAMCTDFYK